MLTDSLILNLSSLFLFIIGASIGSFLNVLSDRLPRNESINGRSYCEFCQKQLIWKDLVPVLSFLLLRGRCRYCKKKLSWWYWLAEVGTGLAFVAVYYILNNNIVMLNLFQHLYQNIEILKPVQDDIQHLGSSIYYLIIVSSLIAIFLADIKYQIIPDQLVVFLTLVSIPLIFQHPASSIFGSVLVSGIILFLYLVTKGKGMGFGDVKLAIPMGLLLGWKEGFLALYLAFVLGGIVGIILIISKQKKMKSKIAFGPFLIIGMILMLFWGDKIISIIFQKFF